MTPMNDPRPRWMGGAYDHLVSRPDDRLKSVSSGLQERTGRTLDEWVAIVQDSGIDPLDQRAVRAWLKDEHGILQNSQWAIADAAARAVGWVRPTLQDTSTTSTSVPKPPRGRSSTGFSGSPSDWVRMSAWRDGAGTPRSCAAANRCGRRRDPNSRGPWAPVRERSGLTRADSH